MLPCNDQHVKNAFLFSCLTGLRISDIRALTFDRIDEGYLRFKQKKTNGLERMKLHEGAAKIIEEQKSINIDNQIVFDIKTAPSLSKTLGDWVKKAGINKHITFHCARHTFATMCLTYDVDILHRIKIVRS